MESTSRTGRARRSTGSYRWWRRGRGAPAGPPPSFDAAEKDRVLTAGHRQPHERGRRVGPVGGRRHDVGLPALLACRGVDADDGPAGPGHCDSRSAARDLAASCLAPALLARLDVERSHGGGIRDHDDVGGGGHAGHGAGHRFPGEGTGCGVERDEAGGGPSVVDRRAGGRRTCRGRRRCDDDPEGGGVVVCPSGSGGVVDATRPASSLAPPQPAATSAATAPAKHHPRSMATRRDRSCRDSTGTRLRLPPGYPSSRRR